MYPPSTAAGSAPDDQRSNSCHAEIVAGGTSVNTQAVRSRRR